VLSALTAPPNEARLLEKIVWETLKLFAEACLKKIAPPFSVALLEEKVAPSMDRTQLFSRETVMTPPEVAACPSFYLVFVD